MTTYERAYQRLYLLIPNLDELIGNPDVCAFKLKSPPYMDLCVDILVRKGDTTIMSFAHYYESNGELVADPDMEFEINHRLKTVEALSIAQMGRHLRVYNGDRTRVDPIQKREQNAFFSNIWLMNLLHQGHRLNTETIE